MTLDAPLTIRPAKDEDDDAFWEIFHSVVIHEDTYAFDPRTSREDALAWWKQPGAERRVAECEGRVVGIFSLKPNQPGLGSHVANAAFMVAATTRGSGVGRRMGEHCILEARRIGFKAIQFNFVVSTNQAAVRLWKRLGFEIVGTLPGAFQHAHRGYVDVYVMFRKLDQPDPALTNSPA